MMLWIWGGPREARRFGADLNLDVDGGTAGRGLIGLGDDPRGFHGALHDLGVNGLALLGYVQRHDGEGLSGAGG